jgi:tRNA A37 threonylcarbamoyladenosine dehydratase
MGGVGSHAALALARSGVGRLLLVDFDEVTPSSLNRHAVAVAADLGRSKAAVTAERISALCADLQVEVVKSFVDAETVSSLLTDTPDFVVDAIDSLNPKVTLLAACVERGLAVVSSMGASSRVDPTQVSIAPLDRTQVCPLARQVRKRLRRRDVPLERVIAVYSTEEPRGVLPPDASEPRLERGRVRNALPSLCTLPGVFGYTLASVVIGELAVG